MGFGMLRMKFWAVAFLTLHLSACNAGPSVKQIDQQALTDLMQSSKAPLIIDVRSEREYTESHIAGAINIPYSHLVKFLTEVPAEKGDDIVLYCEAGVRSEQAFDLLHKAGWQNLYHLEGDMRIWRKAGLPTA